MQRTIVVRLEDNIGKINVNDEIGLDPHSDYMLAEHLEDLEDDGYRLSSVSGPVHTFSNGTIMILFEEIVPIELDRLDSATRELFFGTSLFPARVESSPRLPA